MSSGELMTSTKESQPRAGNAPVFVLGSVRSGTTLLYHMLLSSGAFAVYRCESHAINFLEPRFGDLRVRKNRERLMDAWLDSKLFWRSGLDAQAIRSKVLNECHNGGDFLRIVMSEIARKQGVPRWADSTPEHLLYLQRIKQTIPDALIVHIIRDGRDVAASLDKQPWIRPFRWDRQHKLLIGALYWEWMVRRGRQYGKRLGRDYCEVRFEELIETPQAALAKVGSFIGHPLDYERIREVGIGSVKEPNTSFAVDGEESDFNPVGRWKSEIPPAKLKDMEELIGGLLQDLGYPPSSVPASMSFRLRRLRWFYFNYFDLKLWLKSRTPLGRFLVRKSLSWL